MNYSAPAASCAADILLLLARSAEPLSVSEMARRLSRSRTLVFRVAKELEATGFLRRLDSGSYWLGIGALEVGGAFVAHADHSDSVRRVLRELSRHTGETTNLGVLAGTEVLYVFKQDGRNSVLTTSHVGARLPATCTALGKALLAVFPDDRIEELFGETCPRLTPKSITSTYALIKELVRVRKRGYAVDDGESILGRCCLAVRVELPGLDGQAAALSVSTAAETFRERRDELVEALRASGEELSRERIARGALGLEAELAWGRG